MSKAPLYTAFAEKNENKSRSSSVEQSSQNLSQEDIPHPAIHNSVKPLEPPVSSAIIPPMPHILLDSSISDGFKHVEVKTSEPMLEPLSNPQVLADVATQTEKVEHINSLASPYVTCPVHASNTSEVEEYEQARVLADIKKRYSDAIGAKIIDLCSAFEDFARKVWLGEALDSLEENQQKAREIISYISDVAKSELCPEDQEVLKGYLQLRVNGGNYDLIAPLYGICGRTNGCTGLPSREGSHLALGTVKEIFADSEGES